MWAGFPCAQGRLSLALVSLLAPAAVTHAQTGLSGAWQAGATTVEVSIDSWGKDCGPRPEPMRSAGGGSVQVEEQGKQLVIRARDRVLQSDRCASPNPAVRRISSARIGNTWTTHCRTDPKDPRSEAATYTLELLSADRLRYRDQSHFDWRLHDSTCKATITTTQLLERRASNVPAPTAGAQPAPGKSAISVTPLPDAQPTCVPGAATKLSLRPAKVELALGGRVCFEARVADARNCPLPDAKPRFALQRGPGIRATLEGRCFRAAERSAEGEGTVRVIATAGGLRDEAEVVVSAEQLPSLIAARVVSGALEGVPDAPAAGAAAPKATAPSPPGQSASRVAARAAPEAESSKLRPWLLALAVLLVLTAVGFVLRKERGERPAAGPATPIPPRSDPAPSPSRPSSPLRCPRCGTRFELGNTFCGIDGERLVADG